jgi:hypothetical protein
MALRKEQIEAIRTMVMRGTSQRMIAEELNLSRQTVRRYVVLLRLSDVATCACGRSMLHRGPCGPRRADRGYEFRTVGKNPHQRPKWRRVKN